MKYLLLLALIPARQDDVRDWFEKLGSESLEERTEAAARLERLVWGNPEARRALARLAEGAEDADVRERVRPLLGIARGTGRAPIRPRASASAFAAGGEIIVWGGHTTGEMKGEFLFDGARFDVVRREWKRIPDPPVRGAHDAVPADGGFYVRDSTAERSPALAFFDLASGKWEELPDPPISTLQIVAIGPDLLGWGSGNASAWYDRSARNWIRLPDAPPPQTLPQVFADAGRVVAVTEDPGVHVLDRKTWKWTRHGLPSLWPKALLHGDALILPGTGGHRAEQVNSLNPVRRLDLNSGRWNRLPDFPGENRTWAQCRLAGDRLVVWGGFQMYTEGNQAKTRARPDGAWLDLKTLKWTSIPPSPVAEYWGAWSGSALFVWNRRGEGAVFDLDAARWESVAAPDGSGGDVAVAYCSRGALLTWDGGAAFYSVRRRAYRSLPAASPYYWITVEGPGALFAWSSSGSTEGLIVDLAGE